MAKKKNELTYGDLSPEQRKLLQNIHKQLAKEREEKEKLKEWKKKYGRKK